MSSDCISPILETAITGLPYASTSPAKIIVVWTTIDIIHLVTSHA
jgi:hypothetical protein